MSLFSQELQDICIGSFLCSYGLRSHTKHIMAKMQLSDFQSSAYKFNCNLSMNTLGIEFYNHYFLEPFMFLSSWILDIMFSGCSDFSHLLHRNTIFSKINFPDIFLKEKVLSNSRQDLSNFLRTGKLKFLYSSLQFFRDYSILWSVEICIYQRHLKNKIVLQP